MTAKRMWEGCRCNFCQQLDPSKELTDEEFSAWLKAHPMDPIEEENAEAAVARLRKRLLSKPGPELNLER